MKAVLLSPILLLLFFSLCQATTIIPPHDLGQLARISNATVVARVIDQSTTLLDGKSFQTYTLQILQCLKGEIPINTSIKIKDKSFHTQRINYVAEGDVPFEMNTTYLLFLNQNDQEYRLQMMSYGVFVLQEKNKLAYFVPIQESKDFQLVQSYDNPLIVYKAERLLQMLQSHLLNSNHIWNNNAISSNIDPQQFYLTSRTKPGFCKIFSDGGHYIRWNGFPSNPVVVHYTAGGDNSYGGSIDQVKNALSDIGSKYLGTNLDDGGTDNFNPNCASGSAIDEIESYVNSNYGSSRNTMVIFNDPCQEIPNLVNCVGVLAYGGSFYENVFHTFDNSLWWTAGYGYVLVNNGLGACLSSIQYKLMLTHEMTHSIDLDHYPANYQNPDSSANMNPVCCKDISPLDVICLDYVYPPIFLALDLVQFKASFQAPNVLLNWEIAAQNENQFFDVERLDHENNWVSIHQFHDNIASSKYRYVDKNPPVGMQFYRLLYSSASGEKLYSKIVSVNVNGGGDSFDFTLLHADQMSIRYTLQSTENSNYDLMLNDLSGELIFAYQGILQNQTDQQTLLHWDKSVHPGIYFVHLVSKDRSITKKIIID